MLQHLDARSLEYYQIAVVALAERKISAEDVANWDRAVLLIDSDVNDLMRLAVSKCEVLRGPAAKFHAVLNPYREVVGGELTEWE